MLKKQIPIHTLRVFVTTKDSSRRQYATGSGRQCTCSGRHVTGSGQHIALSTEKSHKKAL